MSKPWLIHEEQGCPFNGGIDCSGASASCSTCGWNPDVQKARVKEWLRKNDPSKFDGMVARIRRLNTR